MTHLVFVYNADSGVFNTLTDIAHKILSPQTYACQLCSLTHSYFSVKKDWTEFLSGIDADLEFLHKDELEVKYGTVEQDLPVILVQQGDRLETWISTEEINQCQSLDALKSLITGRLGQVSM